MTITQPIDSLAQDGNFRGKMPWFMRSDAAQSLPLTGISNELSGQLKQFMRDGFIVLENSVAPKICDHIQSQFKRFTDRNRDYFDKYRDANGYLHRIVNLHLALPSLVCLFSENRKALDFQDALFGAETTVYTSLYFERGSTQAIHRDTPYFCTRPEYCYVGMWVALEDATEENGCLEAYRGGHLVPEIDRTKFGTLHYGDVANIPPIPLKLFDAYQTHIQDQCRNAGLVKELVPLKKGSTLIWHPQLPHGGSAIRNSRLTRHSIVFHNVPLGTPVFQANAFFNPGRELPDSAAWGYETFKGRKFAKHQAVEVLHRDPRPPQDFRKVEEPSSLWSVFDWRR